MVMWRPSHGSDPCYGASRWNFRSPLYSYLNLNSLISSWFAICDVTIDYTAYSTHSHVRNHNHTWCAIWARFPVTKSFAQTWEMWHTNSMKTVFAAQKYSLALISSWRFFKTKTPLCPGFDESSRRKHEWSRMPSFNEDLRIAYFLYLTNFRRASGYILFVILLRNESHDILSSSSVWLSISSWHWWHMAQLSNVKSHSLLTCYAALCHWTFRRSGTISSIISGHQYPHTR